MGGRLIPDDYEEECQWWDAVAEDSPDPENPWDWKDTYEKVVWGTGESQEIDVIHRRPTWDEYFLEMARTASLRSDCDRDKVGAVIVDKDNRVRITGYNGAPKGAPGCVACPRRTSGCAPGSAYDTGVSRCNAVHAEMNALLWAREDLTGATLYVTREPCFECAKNIAGAGIERVVTP